MSAHEPYRIEPIVETPLFDVVYFDRATGRELGLAAFRMTIAGATTVVNAWSTDPLLSESYSVAMRPCSTVKQADRVDLRTVDDSPVEPASHPNNPNNDARRESIHDEFEVFAHQHELGRRSDIQSWIIGRYMRESVSLLIHALNSRDVVREMNQSGGS